MKEKGVIGGALSPPLFCGGEVRAKLKEEEKKKSEKMEVLFATLNEKVGIKKR